MASRMSRAVMLVVLVAAAALAYSLLISGSADSEQQAMSPAAESAISHVSAFQQPAEAADEVPGETLLAGVIRRVAVSSSKRPVWASIDASEVCVQVGQEGATACDTPQRVEAEPLIVGAWHGPPSGLDVPGTPRPPAQEWAGVAANDVESIDVTYGDGSTQTVPVVNSGFYFQTDRTVKTFDWTANGALHTQSEGS